MKSFDTISFKGTFRDYQQKILSHTNQYLQDNKIHIVAAPGSGKTILGLELIRKIGKPALIFSPTVVIRQQWGERFSSNFIPEGKCIEEFMSYDLKSPGLLTSVTYQALHAAVTKGKVKAVDDEEVLEEEQEEDFSDFRISDVIVEAGIGTICLDEAHHLRSEWQKALEGFVKALPREIKILSLTATPPYDSTPPSGTDTFLCAEKSMRRLLCRNW